MTDMTQCGPSRDEFTMRHTKEEPGAQGGYAGRDLMDLKAPPSNHLENLKGHLAGFWSIRVNEQYRVIFRFANGNADEVRIVDYH
jgi:mRNA-degrading endonuclease RelE of RelBE toxin-antitoxin system